MPEISPRFIRKIIVNLAYWQKQAADLSDTTIQKLDKEHTNLLQAITLGIVPPSTRFAAATVALFLFPLIDQCGHSQIWVPLYGDILTCLDTNQTALRIDLLNRQGELFRLDRNVEMALRNHKEALTLSELHDIKAAIAEAHFNLSEDYRLLQRYEKAETHGELSLSQLQRIDAPLAKISSTLNTLGLIAQERGDYAVSEKYLRKSIVCWRQTALSTQLARTLNNLAITMYQQQAYHVALQLHIEAGELLESSPSEIDRVKTQLLLGRLYFHLKQFDKAEFIFRDAGFKLKNLRGYSYYQAMVLQSLGNVLLKQGELDEAKETLSHSLQLWQQNNDELMKANTLGTLGEVLGKQGMHKKSLYFYDEAILLLRKYPDNAWAQKLLAAFLKEQHDIKQQA